MCIAISTPIVYYAQGFEDDFICYANYVTCLLFNKSIVSICIFYGENGGIYLET